ncbi:hypothetical protein Tco_0214476 [Tanacetum coccineum]
MDFSMGLVMGIYGSKLKACGDEFRNQHAIAVAAAEYETKVVAILVRNNNGDKVGVHANLAWMAYQGPKLDERWREVRMVMRLNLVATPSKVGTA